MGSLQRWTWTLALGAGLLTGCGESPARTIDDQARDLVSQYTALPDDARLGGEGSQIIQQLQALEGNLSEMAQDSIRNLAQKHNAQVERKSLVDSRVTP